MQKILLAFVSVVTLMGMVTPSSAFGVQERNAAAPLVPNRRDDGRHPQPSHHFKHKHDGQHVERDLLDFPPSRRDGGRHPQPSHHFNHKHDGQNEQRDISDLPPSRRDDGRHPQPSHRFKHKHDGQHEQRDLSDLPPTRRDPDHPRPSHHFKHKHGGQHEQRDLSDLPPTRRDPDHPQPSHRFKHKDHGHGDDGNHHQERNSERLARGLPPLPPARRDFARPPRPSHHFKHKHDGQNDNQGGDHEQREILEPPTRRDDVHHPHPSKHFEHPHPPSRRDSSQPPRPSHHFKFKTHGGDGHQERNSDRLARGLPPLPPSRRDGAKSPQPSHHHFKHKGDHTDKRVELRDTSGKSLGYLTDFTGSGQSLTVKYNAGAHTLSYNGDNVGNAQYLGAYLSQTDLGPSSPIFVYLTNVGNHDQQANADIWSLDGNKLVATWKNADGTTTPVHFCLNSAGNSIVLTGDPSSLPGYDEVDFYLD